MPETPRSLPLAPQKQGIRQTWHERQLKIRKAEVLHPMERKKLAAVARMRALFAPEAAIPALLAPEATPDTTNTADTWATKDIPHTLNIVIMCTEQV